MILTKDDQKRLDRVYKEEYDRRVAKGDNASFAHFMAGVIGQIEFNKIKKEKGNFEDNIQVPA